MCGRFSNRYTWPELHALYQLSVGFPPPSNFQPRYNVAPTDTSWIVRTGEGGRELAPLRWGLLPSWVKDIRIGASMINVRAETVRDKFPGAFEVRPCLVVPDGFYEWKELPETLPGPANDLFGVAPAAKKKSQPEKQPYFITLRDAAPFAFGGLWERWQSPDGDAIETFTIVTTEPNALCAQVHDRMPLVLAPEMWNDWLGPVEARMRLMKPFPTERMEMWPVSTRVGSVKNDDADLIVPTGPTVRTRG